MKEKALLLLLSEHENKIKIIIGHHATVNNLNPLNKSVTGILYGHARTTGFQITVDIGSKLFHAILFYHPLANTNRKNTFSL